MNKRVELPLIEPVYSTYHFQGAASAIIANNPSIRNWCMNQVMNLTCSRKFLSGFTTPKINIVRSHWSANPYLDRNSVPTKFTKGYINPIIREMLDNGYYVNFTGVDDYYVEGKSWYMQRHASHDGLICGYDQEDKTYCIYAYDSNWVYRKFWTSQKGFNTGRIAMYQNGKIGTICAMKAKEDQVDFAPETAYAKIREYLDSSIEKYPFEGEEEDVFGIVVHQYIAEYISKLETGEIPYERMDRRVFRLIWEHKKVMLERIGLIEKCLDMGAVISEKYKPLVAEANTMRMLYASHHMKRRDAVLPIIKRKLLTLMIDEQVLLTELVERMEQKIKNETVEVSQK